MAIVELSVVRHIELYWPPSVEKERALDGIVVELGIHLQPRMRQDRKQVVPVAIAGMYGRVWDKHQSSSSLVDSYNLYWICCRVYAVLVQSSSCRKAQQQRPQLRTARTVSAALEVVESPAEQSGEDLHCTKLERRSGRSLMVG